MIMNFDYFIAPQSCLIDKQQLCNKCIIVIYNLGIKCSNVIIYRSVEKEMQKLANFELMINFDYFISSKVVWQKSNNFATPACIYDYSSELDFQPIKMLGRQRTAFQHQPVIFDHTFELNLQPLKIFGRQRTALQHQPVIFDHTFELNRQSLKMVKLRQSSKYHHPIFIQYYYYPWCFFHYCNELSGIRYTKTPTCPTKFIFHPILFQ